MKNNYIKYDNIQKIAAGGESNYENNFPHKLLLTNTQLSKLRKTF